MAAVRSVVWRLVLVPLILSAIPARAQDMFRYREGSHEGGELGYRNGLPVLVVKGTPEEMGRQQAALTGDAAPHVLDHPKRLLRVVGLENRFSTFLERSRSLRPQIPEHHLAELEAFAKTAGLDPDLLIGVNTMVDVYRARIGCSSLIVDAERSATGGPLFGRNLDFYGRGTLHRYSLVVVYRPRDKHAFVSVGFPGMLGCLSGMNDAGLAVAVHEVFFSKDRAAMFNPQGVPYTLCLRRILEECTTIKEAEDLVRSTPRTTLLNLVMCDREDAAVLEMTPRNVVLRRGEAGICACTNHFRTDPLAVLRLSPRYRRLMKAHQLPQIGLGDVAGKLHEVSRKRMTLQTMVFEPAPLVLHLAIGPCPASALPLRRLELADLLGGP